MLDFGSKILLIDDEPQILKVLHTMLVSLGHEVVATRDSTKAVGLVTEDNFDLLISDIKMPKMTGIEVAQRVHEINPDLPIILLTGFPELDTARAAIRVGVEDYVPKPVQIADLDSAIKRALSRKTMGLDRTINELLSLCKAAGEVEKRYLDVLREIARLVETGRQYAHGHVTRVSRMVELLAKRMNVPQEDTVAIRMAAELRDIGMIAVPIDLLTKAEALTDSQRRAVGRHSVVGAGLLARLPVPSLVSKVVLHHHDRYDGTENPSGLPSKEIPLGAYIVAVVDAYDAMTSSRPWRGALKRQAALATIAEGVGKQFHPEVAKAFLAMMEHKP